MNAQLLVFRVYAGLTENFPEQRNTDVTAMWVGYSDGETTLSHEGVFAAWIGTLETKFPKANNQLSARNRSKHSVNGERSNDNVRLLGFVGGCGSLGSTIPQELPEVLDGTIPNYLRTPTLRGNSEFRRNSSRHPKAYSALFLKQREGIQVASVSPFAQNHSMQNAECQITKREMTNQDFNDKARNDAAGELPKVGRTSIYQVVLKF